MKSFHVISEASRIYPYPVSGNHLNHPVLQSIKIHPYIYFQEGYIDARFQHSLFQGIFLQLIRSHLVHVIIQPVGVKIIAVGSPLQIRLFRVVIPRIIVLGNLDGKSLVFIPLIFVVKRIPVVLRMSHDINLLSALCHAQQHSRLI